MKVNVFEGARRIVLLLKVVWVLGCIVVVWNQKPYISRYYATAGPSAPFVRSEGCNTVRDHSEYLFSHPLEGGKTISLTLCFKAQPFPNGAMLVPYREDGGQWWGRDSYATEVKQYAEARAAGFTLPVDEKKAAVREWDRERRSQLWNGLGFAVGGWIAIAIVSGIIGWIVRGFFGIAWGSDHRPELVSKTTAAPASARQPERS